jgi:hypothetical protein
MISNGRLSPHFLQFLEPISTPQHSARPATKIPSIITFLSMPKMARIHDPTINPNQITIVRNQFKGCLNMLEVWIKWSQIIVQYQCIPSNIFVIHNPQQYPNKTCNSSTSFGSVFPTAADIFQLSSG